MKVYCATENTEDTVQNSLEQNRTIPSTNANMCNTIK